MDRRTFLHAVTATAAMAGTAALPNARAATSVAKRISMHIGWPPLAPVGMIFEALKHTNIRQLNGIDATFTLFTDGGPLAEAALSGAVDNIVAGDFTAYNGAAKKAGFKAVMRPFDWRWAVVVQPDFKGTSLADLRGKKLMGPFSGGSWAASLKDIEAAGITDVGKNVTLLNATPADSALALQNKLVDAAVLWDPTLESTIHKGYGKVLHMAEPSEAIGIQVLSADYLLKYGDAGAVQFCKAWLMATWWTSHNGTQAREWFAKDTRLDMGIVEVAQKVDRYLKAPVADIGAIDLEIKPAEIAYSQSIMDYLSKNKFIPKGIAVAPLVDNTYINQARAQIMKGDLPDIKLIKVTT